MAKMDEPSTSGSTSCSFPLFRQKFLPSARWTDADDLQKLVALNVLPPAKPAVVPPLFPPQQPYKQPALPPLDLAGHQVDIALTESQNKLIKHQYFLRRCSEVEEGVFVGGEAVAKDRAILNEHGITHVVNCVGNLCVDFFADELAYKTLYLQDTPSEDILCMMPDVLEFIDCAVTHHGRVLVHCSQGVSRSASFAIAYAMWRHGLPFHDAFARVKAARGVVGPNIGFTVQLMNWHKRRTNPPDRPRIYRVAPFSSAAPRQLVLKEAKPPPGRALQTLDIRGAFLIHTQDALYVWQGARCHPHLIDFAHNSAKLLAKFENAPSPAIHVNHGHEPVDLLTALALMDDPPAADTTPRNDTPASSISPTGDATAARPRPLTSVQSGDPLTFSETTGEVDTFTEDYNLYLAALLDTPLGLPPAAHPTPPIAIPQLKPQLPTFLQPQQDASAAAARPPPLLATLPAVPTPSPPALTSLILPSRSPGPATASPPTPSPGVSLSPPPLSRSPGPPMALPISGRLVSNSLALPNTNLGLPTANLPLSNGNPLPLPTGSFALPSNNLGLSTASLALPTGGLARPAPNLALPTPGMPLAPAHSPHPSDNGLDLSPDTLGLPTISLPLPNHHLPLPLAHLSQLPLNMLPPPLNIPVPRHDDPTPTHTPAASRPTRSPALSPAPSPSFVLTQHHPHHSPQRSPHLSPQLSPHHQLSPLHDPQQHPSAFSNPLAISPLDALAAGLAPIDLPAPSPRPDPVPVPIPSAQHKPTLRLSRPPSLTALNGTSPAASPPIPSLMLRPRTSFPHLPADNPPMPSAATPSHLPASQAMHIPHTPPAATPVYDAMQESPPYTDHHMPARRIPAPQTHRRAVSDWQADPLQDPSMALAMSFSSDTMNELEKWAAANGGADDEGGLEGSEPSATMMCVSDDSPTSP